MAGRRAATRERNRAALVRAARELFTVHGYQATGIEAVAEAADLTTGAIYSIFGAKHGLLLAVLDEVFVPLDEAVRPLADDRDLTAPEVLARYARSHRAVLASVDGPPLLRLEVEALALIVGNAQVRAGAVAQDMPRREALVALLTGRRRAGTPGARLLTAAEARRIATPLSSLLRGLAQQQVLDPDAVDDAAWTDAAVALLALAD